MYEYHFPQQTNKATFNPIIEVKEQATGDLIDLSDVDITFEIKSPDARCVLLSATKDNGKIVLLDTGYYQVTFTPDDLGSLCPNIYRIHSMYTRDGVTRDDAIGTLPIVSGAE